MQRVDRVSAALAAISQTQFDAVLLDLGLPDSSGIETLRAVRKQAEELPVVVLTGFDDDDVASWFDAANLIAIRRETHPGASTARDLPATFIASARVPN